MQKKKAKCYRYENTKENVTNTYKNSVRYEESLFSYRWFIKCLFLEDTDVRVYVGALLALVLVTCRVTGWNSIPICVLGC